MRKKILGLLLIGLTTLGITQAYDYYSIYPGLEMEYKGLTYTCDNNANCTTTDQNDNTFNGLFFTSNNYGSNGRAYAFFYDSNNEGYLSQFRGYIGGTYTYSQRSPIQGCFGTYEKAMGDFNNDKVCNWSYNGQDGSGNANTGNTLSWLSDTSLAGQLYSVRFSPFGDQIIICYNYGTGTNSFCFLSQDNQGSNINYGIDFNTAYGQVFTSKLSLLPAGNSPRIGGGGGDNEETPLIYTGTITNQHAIYAYEQLGLTPQQCYGGYPIDTIYNTGNILYQGYQAGTGASILDLYNLYSGNYNGYQSTYMTEEQTKISQFLSEIYQGYENNGLSFFIGKPEAIITIIQQYNNENKKATEKGRGYSLFQLYTYCDLLINKNNNEEYTGNTATPDMWWNGIDTENQEIVLPVTGSVFDELQEDGEFKRNKAQDVRDTINSVYTKLTKIFNLRGGVQGIIPDYITRILLLIILFAIFKK